MKNTKFKSAFLGGHDYCGFISLLYIRAIPGSSPISRCYPAARTNYRARNHSATTKHDAYITGQGDTEAANNNETSDRLDTCLAEELSSDDLLFYLTDDGRHFVRLFSEDIVAYRRWEWRIHLISGEWLRDIRAVRQSGLLEEFDMADFQHRLEMVYYNFRVHYSLEPEINRITKRNLVADGVLPLYFEFDIIPRILLYKS